MIAASLFLASCDSGESPTLPEGTDILGVLAADGKFASFVETLPLTGLEATLRGSGPFTVFASTDMAFEFLGSETVGRLLASDNRELLTRVIKFHIVPGLIRLEDLTEGLELQTLDGSVLRVEVAEEELRIGGAYSLPIPAQSSETGRISRFFRVSPAAPYALLGPAKRGHSPGKPIPRRAAPEGTPRAHR